MAEKIRADLALVSRGIIESRAKAQALIKAGLVYVGGQKVSKSGLLVSVSDELTIRGIEHPWVSRGGMKLDGAVKAFGIDFTGKTVLDIGSSTGGFTDVALSYGAQKVYAVDVGKGQLVEKLRNDHRVVVMEQTNARYLNKELISQPVDVIVCDASFISLKIVLPAALSLIKKGGELVALIKPQFEVGKGRVGKGGIVKDPKLHNEVCDDISLWLNAQSGWSTKALEKSPIEGPDGNIEFLIYGKSE